MTTTVYIIGFNSQSRIDRAFASVPEGFRKVLVDNGTTQLVPPKDMEVMRYSSRDSMFTDAVNAALCDAMEEGHIPIICNDDIELEPGCLEVLVAEIESGAGIACPMQVSMTVPDTVIMGGTGQAYPYGRHVIGRRGIDGTVKADYRWLPFCVTAFHPGMVTEVGLLDKCLRMWFSDSDYCIRARLAGWRVMYCPEAVVRHEQSASVSEARQGGDDRMAQIMVMDQAHFARKWGGGALAEYS